MITAYILVLFAIFICATDGCSCMWQHPQKSFCNAKLAIKGRVVGMERTDFVNNMFSSKIVYKVRVQDIYKKPWYSEIKENEIIQMESAGSTATCGVVLLLNTNYLLTGYTNQKGQWSLSYCDWNRKFDSLTKYQRRGIRGEYDCDCSIVDEYAVANGEILLSKTSCSSATPGLTKFCTALHGFCGKGQGEMCRWTVDKSKKVCQ